mgnify:CR=1 FL=1|tara:strand:- start:1844 stop:2272 length:429 start_codon:yes stop_codon:yes gene_type:complete
MTDTLNFTGISCIQRINIYAWVIAYTLILSQPVVAEPQKKTQPDNIIQCFTCWLKNFSDWTWEQEKRLGMREDPKYITCRRYKVVATKSGEQVCLYRGANDTYKLVVEGQCPAEYRCKYDPDGEEPNIDSVVDSLNDSFKKK